MLSIKKILTILFIFLLIFTISSCVSYDEIKPDESDYASWDGNYVYYGNKRCKTTGENEEVLIEEVTFEGNDYYIVDTLDYCFNNNNIYFIFAAKTLKNLEEFNSTLFIKYIIKTKTYEVLGVGDKTSYNSIVKNFDNIIYLKVNTETVSSDYLVYDVASKNYTIISDVNKISFVDKYVIIHSGGLIKYSKTNNLQFITIGEASKENIYGYLLYNNKEYITIKSSKYDKQNNKSISYSVYELSNNKLQTIVSFNDNTDMIKLNDEYFILFMTKDYEYRYKSGGGCTKATNMDCALNVENKLCKINYDKLTYEVVYEFKKSDYDFTNGFVKDNSYFVNAKYVKRGWFIFSGDIKSKNYELNLNNNGLRKIKTLPNKIEPEFITKSTVVYKNFEYKIEIIAYGGILANLSAKYLYCYNKDTNEKMLMQFYTKADIEEGRHAESLFTDATFDVDHILILSY